MGYNKNDMARMAGETQFLRDNLEKVLRLTEDEKAFVEAFRAKDYWPELLFDDAEVVARVQKHPMAAWKVR